MKNIGEKRDIRRPEIREGLQYSFISPESFYYFLSLLGNQLGERIPDIKFKEGIIAELSGKVLLLTEDDGRVHQIFSLTPLASIVARLERNSVRYVGFEEITLSGIAKETFQRMDNNKDRIYFCGYLLNTSDTLGDFDFAFYGPLGATNNKTSKINPSDIKMQCLEDRVKELEKRVERMANYLY